MILLLVSSIFNFAHANICHSDLQKKFPEITNKDCVEILKLRLPSKLPESPGNKYADNTKAAYLGFNIYYDARFSSNSNVRCANCHMPELSFAENKKVSLTGIRPLKRNSPSLLNSSRMKLQFWDGRADSVWSQTLMPTEHPDEMNFSRLEVVHALNTYYKGNYESIAGKFPDLSNKERFPIKGKPGDKEWDSMREEDKKTVNRIFSNYGKFLEAYIRKVSSGKSSLDYYLEGNKNALTVDQKKGLVKFVTAGCLDCHNGPMLSDEKFYSLNIKSGDLGLQTVRAKNNEFNSESEYADKKTKSPALVIGKNHNEVGAFKTPTLRNLAATHPYGHNGSFATIIDVIKQHSNQKIVKELSEEDLKDIQVFLEIIRGEYPPSPWNNWPDR